MVCSHGKLFHDGFRGPPPPPANPSPEDEERIDDSQGDKWADNQNEKGVEKRSCTASRRDCDPESLMSPGVRLTRRSWVLWVVFHGLVQGGLKETMVLRTRAEYLSHEGSAVSTRLENFVAEGRVLDGLGQSLVRVVLAVTLCDFAVPQVL